MKHGSERRVIAGGFLLALLLMGGLRLVSYRNAIALIHDTQHVEKTEDDLKALAAISAGLANAESGCLAYLLFGNEADRHRHDHAKAQVDLNLQKVTQSLQPDEDALADLASLQQLLRERRGLADKLLAMATAPASPLSQQASVMAQINANRREIEQVLDRMSARKLATLNREDAQLVEQTRVHLAIEYLGTLAVFALLIGLFWVLDRQLVRRQRVEAERQELAQAKEMGDLKLRFFSMVSHEFRTPLSVILGSAQLLAEKLEGPDPTTAARHLDRIQTSARSLNQLLSDILTLTRAEAGKLELHPTAIDLEEFCLNLVEDLSVATDPPRQIHFQSVSNSAKAEVDEKLLQGLLSNLLSNALKYSEPDTPVSLTLLSSSKCVTFEVSDRGIGIAPEELASLCEPFYRGHNRGWTQGAGLGLAVCKKCVELHHGAIAIQSEVGVGTTVTVTLPSSQPEESSAENQPRRVGPSLTDRL